MLQTNESVILNVEKYGQETGKCVVILATHFNQLSEETDADRCIWSDKVREVINKWREFSNSIEKVLAELSKLLPELEGAEQTRQEGDEILNQMLELIRELSPIESQQKYELQAPHQENGQLLQTALNKQQELVHKFSGILEPKFRVLAEKYEIYLSKTENQASNPRILSTWEQLNQQWQTVWKLTSITINKLKALIQLCERLQVSRTIIEEFRDKLNTIRYNSIGTEEELSKQLQLLTNLAKTVTTSEPKFVDLGASMDVLRSSMEGVDVNESVYYTPPPSVISRVKSPENDRPVVSAIDDRDCNSFGRVVEELINKWEEIKKSIKRGLGQIEDRRQFNDKLKYDRAATDLSNILNRWLNQVESLLETIKQRAASPSPTREQEMNLVSRENENIQQRLNEIFPQIGQIITEAEKFVSSYQEPTQQLTDIINSKTMLKSKTEDLQIQWSRYIKKITALEKVLIQMMKIGVVVSKFEDQLVIMNVLPTNANQLRQFIEKVEMLQGEVPVHEPEFANLDIIFMSAIQEIEVAYKEDSLFLQTDSSISGYKNEISSLKKRWQEIKQQLAGRLSTFYQQLSQLESLDKDFGRHNDWLDNTERRIQEPDLAQPGDNSEKLQVQIQQHIEILNHHEDQVKSVSKMEETVQTMKQTVSEYKDSTSKYASCVGIVERRTTFSGQEQTEVEITRIRRRYDRLGNVIKERVEKFKVFLDKARKKEVSTLHI